MSCCTDSSGLSISVFLPKWYIRLLQQHAENTHHKCHQRQASDWIDWDQRMSLTHQRPSAAGTLDTGTTDLAPRLGTYHSTQTDTVTLRQTDRQTDRQTHRIEFPSPFVPFLPCCMEWRRGLAMRILSVRLSNECIVTKRKKDMFRFLYHMKDI